MKKILILVVVILSIFVFNSSVNGYKKYSIGDLVKYNDIDFYVIEDSNIEDNYVTLVKAKSLSFNEVKSYLEKIDSSLVDTLVSFPKRAYGYMPFYISSDCGVYVNDELITSGCITDYSQSNVKKVVDAWVDDKIVKENLIVDSTGYYARLMNEKDLFTNLRLEITQHGDDSFNINSNANKWELIYDSTYWTMIPASEREYGFMTVMETTTLDGDKIDGLYCGEYSYDTYNVASIRPVINLKKSVFEKDYKEDGLTEIDDLNSNEEKVNDVEKNDKVSVPNTLKSISGLIILIGMVLVCIGINIFIIVKNRNGRKKERI